MTEQAPQRSASSRVVLIVAWLWVLIPFGYGLYELIRSMTQLFD